MKSLYTLLLFVCFLNLHVNAQTDVLNGGFEDWNDTVHIRPDFWQIDFIHVGMCTPVPFNEKTTDAHSGSYALLTNNVICDGTTHMGYFHNHFGTHDNPASTIAEDIGTPIEILPENWSFYYKFLPTGTDSAVASICLFQYDSTETSWFEIIDTIAFSEEYILNEQDSYAFKNLSLNYINSIDFNRAFYISVLFKIKGSNETTRLIIDDVHVSGNLGVSENTEKGDLFLHPNPAKDQVQIVLSDDESVQLRDLKGKEIVISLQKINEKTHTFDVSKLAKGVYLVTIYSIFGQKTERLLVN